MSSPLPTPTATVQVARPTATATVAPTSAPMCQEESNDPGDHPNAVFVADLTIPDGSHIKPDTPFDKTWRMRNSGACTWPEGTAITFITGYPIPGPREVIVGAVSPGSEIDVTVPLTTPSRRGIYKSYWRLQTPGNHLFGAVVFIEMTVTEMAEPLSQLPTPSPVSTSTPRATPSPQPTPSPTATLSASPTPTLLSTSALTPTGDLSFGAPSPSDGSGPSTCEAPDPRFKGLLDQAPTLGVPIGCAEGPLLEASGAVQAYWPESGTQPVLSRPRSLVIRRDDVQRIYVLDGEDAKTTSADFSAYENTWDPTQGSTPKACSALSPATGFIMPADAIGKVWCEKNLRFWIGWPVQPAQPAALTIQEISNGLLMEVTSPSIEPLQIAIDWESKSAIAVNVP
ncbi:MAG: NBR1-Ig-like domain-containing protein [Anaerolineae bacterium]